jgi:hypothetical protein
MRRDDAVGAGELRKGIARLGVLQIDSVNILVRAHYLPLYSRLGSYEPAPCESSLRPKATGASSPFGRRPIPAVTLGNASKTCPAALNRSLVVMGAAPRCGLRSPRAPTRFVALFDSFGGSVRAFTRRS